ncbi:MAG: hypothetical protein DMG36_02925 [Acidobacteria bacterium]|nr:MAG: hypothetical protein DMG36_02925 [Acidobacteriota bacterium]
MLPLVWVSTSVAYVTSYPDFSIQRTKANSHEKKDWPQAMPVPSLMYGRSKETFTAFGPPLTVVAP